MQLRPIGKSRNVTAMHEWEREKVRDELDPVPTPEGSLPEQQGSRELYDNIRDSFVNGQFSQAKRQMEELDGDSLAEMLNYFAFDLNDRDLAHKAAVSLAKSLGRSR